MAAQLLYNSGYTTRIDGTAISVNAERAELEGKFTEGKFRQMYGVSKKAYTTLCMLGLIKTHEWHHTGKSFKRSDFYEWEDHTNFDYGMEYLIPEESLADSYDKNKKEIDVLAKSFDNAAWEFEALEKPVYVPEYDAYKEHYVCYNFNELLSCEERETLANEHESISAQRGEIGGYERKLMHEEVDAKYKKLAECKVDDAMLRQEYEAKFGEVIVKNRAIEAENELRKARNAESRGKEYILAQIGEIMGMGREKAEYMANRAAEENRIKEAVERRKRRKEEINKQAEAIRYDGKKKLDAYVNRLLKEGRAERVNRLSWRPEFLINEEEEMNGRYGWFAADSRYNLTVYYSGIDLKSKRSYNHYTKLKEDIDRKVSELYQQLD